MQWGRSALYAGESRAGHRTRQVDARDGHQHESRLRNVDSPPMATRSVADSAGATSGPNPDLPGPTGWMARHPEYRNRVRDRLAVGRALDWGLPRSIC